MPVRRITEKTRIVRTLLARLKSKVVSKAFGSLALCPESSSFFAKQRIYSDEYLLPSIIDGGQWLIPTCQVSRCIIIITIIRRVLWLKTWELPCDSGHSLIS